MIKAAFSKTIFPGRFLFIIFLFPVSLGAQSPRWQTEYIARYSEEAVRQMVLYRIPASVILAQAIFESRGGTSELARRSNNHFGIKCHREWGGDTIIKTDDTLNECFRRYACVEDSYTDHSLFLASRARYAPLFLLDPADYKGWCHGLKAAGYATYASYAEELIRIIEKEKLYILDRPPALASRFMLPGRGDICESKLNPGFFSLREFAIAGVMWLDEKDVFIPSLEVVVETDDDGMDAIAGD